ncbi:polysaccharide deacetylase family protein [Bartonella sp. HY329]|uniref:polysaccharide deacetylase family protein n=1 Tax=unclassified Bartonella TaxID=2645622 RepID=UPI0021CA654F|nr:MULTISPECIES: polysaccharide deacetylase family protein [unclassified Bartonella]UXM94783.1 polysaccharide deacetylase family protein [Bartonella sp. HY329]UXN09106.1 polysaccharide deacetylase family protein [Bartonella sp. HY328]
MAIPILLYHHIDEPPPSGTPSRSNYVSPKNFAKQMAWLNRLGIKGLSLKDAMPYILEQKQGRIAVITFDDGFLSVFENAMPILNQHGFTATNYFVANEIAGQNNWDNPKAKRAACMDITKIKQWLSYGHEVGSHTLSHPHLSQLSSNEAFIEINQSKQKLETALNIHVSSFAYPYGDENDSVRNIVEQAGYSNAVTTRRGRVQKNDKAFELPRHSVRRNDSALHFLLKCLVR